MTEAQEAYAFRKTKRERAKVETDIEIVIAKSGVNIPQILDRLAAYEDTGFTPEDFDELCRFMSETRIAIGIKTFDELRKAVEDGVIIRLPCKVDDTIWWIERLVGDDKPFIRSSQVSEIGISDAITIYEYDGKDFAIEDVYFTREEAEAALVKED